MPKYNISPDKRYSFPEEIRIVDSDQSILVIAPQSANWIVLQSLAQKDIFLFLGEGHSIKDALENNHFIQSDVNYIVTQIEARKFCNKKIVSCCTNDDRNLHLYLTNKCNLFCPHCYMFSGRSNEKELTTDEVIDFLTKYRNITKGKILTLSGGEPTCHSDFDLIVKTAAEIGFDVKVLTNGTLMTAERVDKIAKYLYSIQISIDGFSEESNSTIRGKGNFDKALYAVDLLVNHGVDTAIAVTPSYSILRNNIDNFVQFAQNLLTKYQDKPFRIKFADELIHGRCVSPSKNFNREYNKLMCEIQQRLYGTDYDVMSFVDMLYGNIVLDNCMFGNFAVASNGDVFYCARIGDLVPMANIRTSSLEEITERAMMAESAANISNLRPCNECELRFICGGGCRIDEFPDLVKRRIFEHIDFNCISPRICDKQIKSHFYDLMVRSNAYFYSPL